MLIFLPDCLTDLSMEGTGGLTYSGILSLGQLREALTQLVIVDPKVSNYCISALARLLPRLR